MARNLLPFRRTGAPVGNHDFVNRAFAFVKRAGDWPGMPLLPLISIAAGVLMATVGAFGTGDLPWGQRAGFWAALMTMEIVKWQIWLIATVRRDSDWVRASLIGTPLLAIALPFEIQASFALVGVEVRIGPGDIWAKALVIGAIIFFTVTAVTWRRASAPAPALIPVAPSAARQKRPDLLDRAGIARIDDLEMVEAEDHYCRLHLGGGGSVLLHLRFGDAIGQLADVDGLQINRGIWVAAASVRGAVRDGRRWWLVTTGDRRVPVSARFANDVRARGWLRPPVRSYPV